jgi:glycosyltransferase involved in cell wall biosynthesis
VEPDEDVTACAVMLVKDEADIIEPNLRHLCAQVDHVIVADNLSTDRTPLILKRLSHSPDIGRKITVLVDSVIAYRQSEKTTDLAQRAFAMGHDWIVPVDADEIWYSPFGRIADVLDGLPEGALFANAVLLNHVTTSDDDPTDENPLTRIGWRIREFNGLPKVACRASGDLVIGMGNHDAVTTGRVRSGGGHEIDGQLYVHHFPWRSAEQFERKIRNGAVAYAAAGEIAEQYGAHWRGFGMPDEPGFADRTAAWYWRWGHRENPAADESLIYDPSP